jgi:hypothetical protein
MTETTTEKLRVRRGVAGMNRTKQAMRGAKVAIPLIKVRRENQRL